MNCQTTPDLEMRSSSVLGSRECLFAWLSILVGFLFARALPAGESPLGTLIFFLLLFAFGGFYIFRSDLRLGRTNYLIAAIPCLFSLGLITGANAVLRFFLVLFLFFAFLYWIYTAFGLKGGATFDDRFVSHALYSIFVLPLSHFYLTFPALGAAKEGSGKQLARGLLFGLCGLGIAIVPTAIVFALLSFDEGFVKLVEDLLPDLSEDFPSLAGDLFLGVIFAKSLAASRMSFPPQKLTLCREASSAPRSRRYSCSTSYSSSRSGIGISRRSPTACPNRSHTLNTRETASSSSAGYALSTP